MKKLTLILLVLCAFTIKAQQNMIINGSFELNTETQCYNSMNQSTWNATVNYTTSFGSQVQIMKDSCAVCIDFPNYFWGGEHRKGIGFPLCIHKPFLLLLVMAGTDLCFHSI